MKIELPTVPYWNINPELSPKAKKYQTLDGAFSRPGRVMAWDWETAQYQEVVS